MSSLGTSAYTIVCVYPCFRWKGGREGNTQRSFTWLKSRVRNRNSSSNCVAMVDGCRALPLAKLTKAKEIYSGCGDLANCFLVNLLHVVLRERLRFPIGLSLPIGTIVRVLNWVLKRRRVTEYRVSAKLSIPNFAKPSILEEKSPNIEITYTNQ